MAKAILHVDGDSFFVSCEVSLKPKLKGLPVVTGEERGIASAMSKEAKNLGISRGMPIYKIRKLFPQAVVLKSDYGLYEIFAQRMFSIVGRYSDEVEEYSIDECFSVIEGNDLLDLTKKVKHDLETELGMTFSLGVAPTKVLAKLASSKNKPDGLTILPPENVKEFLKDIDVGKVWGIGPATSRELRRQGIETALDLASRGGKLAKPVLEIQKELSGISLYKVSPGGGDQQKSVQATRTFKPPSTDKVFLLSELSKNIENASVKMREQGLVCRRVHYMLKTQEFRYHRFEIELARPASTPVEILKPILETFGRVYKPRIPYRATGVSLLGLIPYKYASGTLFEEKNDKRWQTVFGVVDRLDKRYGSHSVVLGSSLGAFRREGDTGFHKRLRIPYLGEV